MKDFDIDINIIAKVMPRENPNPEDKFIWENASHLVNRQAEMLAHAFREYLKHHASEYLERNLEDK